MNAVICNKLMAKSKFLLKNGKDEDYISPFWICIHHSNHNFCLNYVKRCDNSSNYNIESCIIL